MMPAALEWCQVCNYPTICQTLVGGVLWDEPWRIEHPECEKEDGDDA